MSSPWLQPITLDETAYRELRMRMMFEHFKLDPQAEDVSALSRVALVLDARAWEDLRAMAEALAQETLAAERELLGRPELWRRLAIPWPVRRVLRHGNACPSAARVMRFDFHYTSEGWRVSEVNSDVPGGFIEGSAFTRLVAEHAEHKYVPGDPAGRYAQSIALAAPSGHIALVHATGYMDDRQVMLYLSRELALRGCRTTLCSPDMVDWEQDRPDLIVRFFPAEWLPNLPRAAHWQRFFRACEIPQSNPGYALLSQSKRLPLVWDHLATPMSQWKRLLPETRELIAIRDEPQDSWVLKPAMGRVGDGILMQGATPAREARSIRRWSRWFPRYWIAQRRFRTVPVETANGLLYPCLGVYTVDGIAAGAYARVAPTPLIDARASDAAVLLARPVVASRRSSAPAASFHEVSI